MNPIQAAEDCNNSAKNCCSAKLWMLPRCAPTAEQARSASWRLEALRSIAYPYPFHSAQSPSPVKKKVSQSEVLIWIKIWMKIWMHVKASWWNRIRISWYVYVHHLMRSICIFSTQTSITLRPKLIQRTHSLITSWSAISFITNALSSPKKISPYISCLSYVVFKRLREKQ